MNIRKKAPQNTPASFNHRKRRKRLRRLRYMKGIFSIAAFTLTLTGICRLLHLKPGSWIQAFSQNPAQLFQESGSLTQFFADAGKNTYPDGSGSKDPLSQADSNSSDKEDSISHHPDQAAASGKEHALNAEADQNPPSDTDSPGPDADTPSSDSSTGRKHHASGSDTAEKKLSESGADAAQTDNGGSAIQHLYPKAADADAAVAADSVADADTEQMQEQTYPDTDTQWIFFSETDSDSQIVSGSRRLQTAPDDAALDDTDTRHIHSNVKDWNLILVNPWNELPDNYEIRLSHLPGGHSIDSRCYSYLMEMLDACSAAGYSPVICSSYRTQEKQESLFQERIDELTAQGYSAKDARIKAAASVARPGTSEHQLGLAVDIVDKSRQTLDAAQEYTPVQQWLMKNSWKYGFILRYPQNKSSLTGIIYEPWHYRYVGVKAAAEIYERGICLEEYLEELQN